MAVNATCPLLAKDALNAYADVKPTWFRASATSDQRPRAESRERSVKTMCRQKSRQVGSWLRARI